MSNDVRSQVEYITDKHGQVHHPNCGLNTENGSYNVCDCYVAELVDDLAELLEQSNRESKLEELKNLPTPKIKYIQTLSNSWAVQSLSKEDAWEQGARFVRNAVNDHKAHRIYELQHQEADPTETPGFKEAVEKGTKAWQGINPTEWVEKERGNTEGGSDGGKN